jgi:hypothetical protein
MSNNNFYYNCLVLYEDKERYTERKLNTKNKITLSFTTYQSTSPDISKPALMTLFNLSFLFNIITTRMHSWKQQLQTKIKNNKELVFNCNNYLLSQFVEKGSFLNSSIQLKTSIIKFIMLLLQKLNYKVLTRINFNNNTLLPFIIIYLQKIYTNPRLFKFINLRTTSTPFVKISVEKN